MQANEKRPKRNMHPTDSGNEECKSNCDEDVEDLRYIKRLELQRTILSRLVGKMQNPPPIDETNKLKDK